MNPAPLVNWLLLVGIVGVDVNCEYDIDLFVNVSLELAVIYPAPFVNWLLFVGIPDVNANVPVADGNVYS